VSTVLVVDDEPIVRDVVARYLEHDGHTIIQAGDGETARKLLGREQPVLVVLEPEHSLAAKARNSPPDAEKRCEARQHSQRGYDRHMAALRRQYLARRPDPVLFAFLRLTFARQTPPWTGLA